MKNGTMDGVFQVQYKYFHKKSSLPAKIGRKAKENFVTQKVSLNSDFQKEILEIIVRKVLSRKNSI